MDISLYIIYFPDGKSASWQVLTEQFAPDTGAFPEYFYRRYKIPSRLQQLALNNAIKERNRMNNKGVMPSPNEEIFPELQDILKET